MWRGAPLLEHWPGCQESDLWESAVLFFCRYSGKDFPREESQPVRDHSKGHLLKTCHWGPRNGSDTEPAPRNYLGWLSHKVACSGDGDGSQRGGFNT